VRKRGVAAWLLDLHRFLGTLTLVALGVHLTALVADNFLYFGPRELLVPFASAWRPAAVAWGIGATYLLVAIQVTSWMMRRLPRRLWHRIHLMSFVVFGASTVHAFQSGSDAGNTLVQWLALTGTTLVVFLVLFRLLAARSARPAAAGRKGPSPLHEAEVAA
jgi:DMSO/TMAO reductase YedYZ heme-binding membrane subunit